MGGRGTVCFSNVVLGDNIIHIFNNQIHMGRIPRKMVHEYGLPLGQKTNYVIVKNKVDRLKYKLPYSS